MKTITPNPNTTSVLSKGAATMNAAETLEHIGIMARLSLGAREFVATEGALTFRIGGGARSLHANVSINAWDLYDVEIARTNRRSGAVEVIAAETDVYCDGLAETLLTLLGRVS